MPQDVRDLLEGVAAPPMRVDPETVVAGGRRRRRRRNRAGVGLLVAVVAVIALDTTAARDPGRTAVPPASSTPVASAPPTTVTSAPRVTARVALTIGHCVVEYVDFDGQTWGLTKEQQFGRGGGAVPPKWPSRTGLMERLSADRARYTDDAGTVLDFLPADDPAVFRIEGRLCA